MVDIGKRISAEGYSVLVPNPYYRMTKAPGIDMSNFTLNRRTVLRGMLAGTAVSFGLPFIANPDLVDRFAHGYPLADLDPATLYTGGESGYTDYPTATATALPG